MIVYKEKYKIVTEKKFRLVYYDKKVIVIINGTDKSKTWTKHDIQELDTYNKALSKVEELNLELPDSFFSEELKDQQQTKG